MDDLQRQIIKTTAFFDVLGMPVTKDRLWDYFIWSEDEVPQQDTFSRAIDLLIQEQQLKQVEARLSLADRDDDFFTSHDVAQKHADHLMRSGRRWAKLLSLFPGVEAIAICNTVALGHASDESDIDLFVVTKPGWLWQTRFFLTAFLHVLGKRPKASNEYGTICLSFFLKADQLDLSSVALPDDIYLDFWIRSLQPVYDPADYIQRLQSANAHLCQACGFPKETRKTPGAIHAWFRRAIQFVMHPFRHKIERKSKAWQEVRFPEAIASALEKGGTEVVVNEAMLKFHTNDRRQVYKEAYAARVREYIAQ